MGSGWGEVEKSTNPNVQMGIEEERKGEGEFEICDLRCQMSDVRWRDLG
jgi:hypothetical protein